MRVSNDALAAELAGHEAQFAAAGIRSVTSIGDALAPATIAAAVYAGHGYAREFDAPASAAVPFLRELPGG
jgi:dimethylamine/trimethylamine dehydrogenase